MVPLLPKLRGQFAEFLNHSSPDRLGILYLTTCVGLGYGPHESSLEAFLGSMGSPCFASFGYASGLTMYHHGFACGGWLHLYTSSTTHWRGCPSASPHRLATIGSGPALASFAPKGSAGSSGQHHRVRHGRAHAGTGISTRCPSTTPVGLALGPGSPWAD